MDRSRCVCAACWLLLVVPAAGRAQAVGPVPPNDAATHDGIALPYAFYDDVVGAAGAFV